MDGQHSLLLGVPLGVGTYIAVEKLTAPLTDAQITALHRPAKAMVASIALGAVMLTSPRWKKAGLGAILGTVAYAIYRVRNV